MLDTKIILASQSPRRRDILKNLGIAFTSEVSDADETLSGNYSPEKAVCELSQRKAFACLEQHIGENVFIIAADTVVVLDGEIIGKPKSKKDAFDILSRLSGRSHEVFTGFTLCSQSKSFTDYERTEVTFNELSDELIRAYIDTGEPMDKAGAYGIQGKGIAFIEKICGDYFNVVGLPASRVIAAANEKFGINLLFLEKGDYK